MGGGKVSVPGPTAQQTQLEQLQIQLLQQQQGWQQMLAPYIFSSMGLTPSFDSSGKITGLTKSPQGLAQDELQKNLNQYATNALTGNLPVDPSLTKSLDIQKQQLTDFLRTSLGPGYATSTPGSTALNQFLQYRGLTEESARRGDIGQATSLALTGEQTQEDIFSQKLANLFGPSQATIGGASIPFGEIQNQQNMQFQGSAFNTQSSNQLLSSLFGGFGNLVGLAGFGGGFGTGGRNSLLSTLFA